MNRTVQTFLCIVTVAVLGFLAQPATAADAAVVAKQMPQSFSGQYQWRSSSTIQKVLITFSDIRIVGAGAVEAIGTGQYSVSGRISHIKVRALVNPDTLDIELWESEPTSSNFITDGSHKGRLSTDLRRIKAVWTTQASQRQGDLTLTAIGNQ